MYENGKYYVVWGYRFSQPYCIGKCTYIGQEKLLVQYSEGARVQIVHKFLTESGTIVYDEDFDVKSERTVDFNSMLKDIDTQEI
ncbi:MAG TPA: hypothetical protein ENI76_02275 [Ignavibacteria bacterium]|mgnify:CR=1 FL=1|nr:hypothetical protein [Ignavibacteria bacterium]